MPLQTDPDKGYPRSLAELKKVMGRNPLYSFLRPLATRDMVVHFDDFLGDTIDGNLYALANSSGTSAADFAIAVAANGTIQGDTGTSDNGAISLIMPLNWYGDQNAGMEVRFKVDDPTDFMFEVGFVQGVPGSNTGAINDIDTPTVYGTDMAVVGMDTDQTLKTMAFVTEASGSVGDPAKTNIGTLVPVAATYMTVRVQLIGNTASAWVDGVKYATHTTAIEGGTAVAPWVYVRTRNTTAKFFDIDYLLVWQERA